MKNIVKIKRALISVSDKSLLENLLTLFSKYKIEIISSGKTYKKIKKLGFKSIEISNFTKSKAMLGGRIKTLHHKIHAGILNIRNNKNHKLIHSFLTLPNTRTDFPVTLSRTSASYCKIGNVLIV